MDFSRNPGNISWTVHRSRCALGYNEGDGSVYEVYVDDNAMFKKNAKTKERLIGHIDPATGIPVSNAGGSGKGKRKA